MTRLSTSGSALEFDCPSIEIAAYLDGELTAEDESLLESHLANCSICTAELNEQKNFINALNTSLNDGPELPMDFTKRVVTNAESGVGGLRKTNEAVNAMFVSVGLLLFVLFTLGAKAVGTFVSFFEVFARIYAVAAVAAHFVFDVSQGIFIVLRALTAQLTVSVPAVIAALTIVATLSYFIYQTRRNTRSQQIESGNIS